MRSQAPLTRRLEMTLGTDPNCCRHDPHTPNHRGYGVDTAEVDTAEVDTAVDTPAFYSAVLASGFGIPATPGFVAKTVAVAALEGVLCRLGSFLLALVHQYVFRTHTHCPQEQTAQMEP